MARDMPEASVAAGESGPVSMLAGEADLTCGATERTDHAIGSADH